MDLFTFPFFADVWGTAADWLLMVVTVSTAVFLYKTLQSQKEVQEHQRQLLEREHQRYVSSIRPYFAIGGYQHDYHNLSISLKFANAICTTLYLSMKEAPSYLGFDYFTRGQLDYNSAIGISEEVTFTLKRWDFNSDDYFYGVPNNPQFRIEALLTDIEGRIYKQEIIANFEKPYLKIKIHNKSISN